MQRLEGGDNIELVQQNVRDLIPMNHVALNPHDVHKSTENLMNGLKLSDEGPVDNWNIPTQNAKQMEEIRKSITKDQDKKDKKKDDHKHKKDKDSSDSEDEKKKKKHQSLHTDNSRMSNDSFDKKNKKKH